MKQILRGQQVIHKIPHYLRVPVGNKTGDTGPVTNDVGIVYARSGPIVMSFCTVGNTGGSMYTNDRIGAAARLIVEYFDDTN